MEKETDSVDKYVVAAQNTEEKKYWLNKLSGEPAKCNFYYDSIPKNGAKKRFRKDEFRFTGELFSKFLQLGNNSDLRLHMILTAGLVMLIEKHTGQKDIIVGTPIYKQDVEVKFINTVLALRNIIDTGQTFKEILIQVMQTILDAVKHVNYPVELLSEQLGMPVSNQDDFPLFDIVILLENIQDKKYIGHINYNIAFSFLRKEDALEGVVEYNAHRYHKETIGNIINHFVSIFQQVLFDVNLNASQVDIISEAEKRKLLNDFNNTAAPYSREKTMHQLFEEQVSKSPGEVAVIDRDGVLRWTYEELNTRSNQLAGVLRKRGVKPGGLIAVIMDRSVHMVPAVMGILKAGGAYVPLEPSLPDERIRKIMESLNIETLITNEAELLKVDRISQTLPHLTHIISFDKRSNVEIDLFEGKALIGPEEVEREGTKNLSPAARPGDIAYVIFTSGSCGTPKGVVETHRPVINVVEWVNETFDVGYPDKLLFVASLSFDLSVYDIFGILASGGCLRVVDAEDIKSPGKLLDIVMNEGITFWDSAPAALQQLVPFFHEVAGYPVQSRLRLVFLSGDWIPVTMPDALRETFAGVQVISLGGATEATIWSNYYPIGVVDSSWSGIPYGKPIQNARYYILDHNLDVCPLRVPGDLYIGGECLAEEYINDAQLSALKFIANPFVPGEKIYRTGDIARWFDDGNMQFLGRKDRQVKIQGYRIELGEIESLLLNHPSISDGIVLDRLDGSGTKYLCAYYVCKRKGDEIDREELKQYLLLELPEYMLPGYFIAIEQVPLTPNGKVDRGALPHPDLNEQSDYTAPGNELEKKLVEIWAEVLNVEKDTIGIDTNFFESGGHSLYAVKMAVKFHKELDVNISLADIFKAATIKALARKIMEMSKETYAEIEPVEKMEYYPLPSAQKRIFLSQQLQLKSTSYNVYQLTHLGENIDRERLEQAFKKLIGRHETLRTSFEVIEEEIVQRISGHVDFAVEYHEEGDLSRGLKTGTVEEILKHFVRPFDLSNAPLLRAALVKTMARHYMLLIDMHHIITDVSSVDILTGDFTALYAGVELEPIGIQYKDFSQWQNSPHRKEQINRQEKYWLDLFSDAKELLPLDLPTDFERPLERDIEGDFVGFKLAGEEVRFLREVAEKIGGTLFMSLLAVLNILLSKLSGREDIVVGIPIEGRRHADLEHVVGLFINTLPIRNFPAKDKSFNDFALETKQSVLDTLDNQEYQFEDLVNKIELKRNLDRNPLIDVMLNLIDRTNWETGNSEENETGENSEDNAYGFEKQTSNFDIVFTGLDFGESLYLNFIYRTKLFKKETIHRFIDYFRRIITVLREDGNISLGDISISHSQKNDEREYWLNTLSGDLVKSYFPFDFFKGGWSKDDVRSIQLKFPDELFFQLTKMTGNSGGRLNVVLVAAVFVLLEKYTGNEDIIIGAPISRQDADADFINTVLTLRNRVSPDVTFEKLILEMGQVILGASKNQNYPIERLLYELNMTLSGNEAFPLFDIAVLLENIHDRRYLRHINTNIVFSFLKSETGITGTLEYNSSVYAERTVERIGSHFLNVLGQAAFNADNPVVEIDILSEEERKELLVDFNHSSADYPKDKTVVQLFREQVQKAPDNVALVFEDKRLTYKKLDEMSNQLGWLLRRKGVAVGAPVGIMVERSLEMVVGIMGVLNAGGAYVPVSPDAPQNRLRYVFDNANIKIVLTQEKYTAGYEEWYHLIGLDSVDSFRGSVETPENINTPRDPAYVIYTSGSTGKPKGVLIRHGSVVNIVKWFARKYDLKVGFNLLQMFEYTFDASVNQIFGSMLHGVTLHIINKENFFDIEFLRDYITGNFINLINFVQSVIKELLCGREKLESLEHVISGAEKLKSSVKNEILDHGYSLYNQYGPTEVTVDATAEKCTRESDGTVGIPVDNAQCYIVNKFGRLNPVGVAGELWVGGDGLALGYINNVELTALKFIPNPFNPGTRVYKTGDLTRWLPRGNVEFLGRIDSQVKIRGFRIEPVEIANQLVKIEGITEAVVIDREDSPGDTYLCAYLVGAREIDTNEIKRLLAQNLPDYMVPSAFVWIDQLPLSGHGKLIPSALPAPDITSGSSEDYVAPENPLEKKLVDIWAGVLNVDKQIVGIKSDFFELGGHSLKAVILMSRIHKELDVRVPLAEVFRSPNIKGLAEYVKTAAKDKHLSLEPVEKMEYYLLASAQKRLYIMNRMDPLSVAYNIRRVIHLGASIDKPRLENAFRELIKRHESLRTSFHMIDETPVQRVHDNVEFDVEYCDLGEKTLALGFLDFVQAFDLSAAPLLRGRVVNTGEGPYYLLVDMHHIISDGTSRLILDRDFLALYRGEKPAPLKLQYKDFSHWQNHERGMERLNRQEEYWLKAFSDEIPVLDLPTDYPRPVMQSFEGSSIDFELTPEITRSLTEYARNAGVTLYMMILATANILFSKLSGWEDIILGVPVAGRGHADLEKIVGLFVNTLALRNYPAAEKTFKTFLGELKDRTLDAFDNQECQFEDLVEKVAAHRDASRNPLFDVMIVLQNFDDMPVAGLQEDEGDASENKKNASQVAKFDLTLAAVETDRGIFFSFQYCTKLFKRGTIERFIRYFRKVLSQVTDERELKLGEMEIIFEEEKHRILYEFNDTASEYPVDKTIHELFEKQAATAGDKIAVNGNVALTYRELNKRADGLACFLREKGVSPDTIVGIMMERSVEMIIGIMGILKSGGAYLPINPDYPKDRIDFILNDSNAAILLTHDLLMELFLREGPLESLRKTNTSSLRSQPGHLAYVIYTSGSTGRPKGVMVQHRSYVNACAWQISYYNITESDHSTQYMPIVFDASIMEIFPCLLQGATLYIVPEKIKLDIHHLNRYYEKMNITVSLLSPQICELFMELENHSLRVLLAGGDILRKYVKRNYRLYNNYGPTENSVVATSKLVETQSPNIPIGTPIHNNHVYIFGRNSFQLQPIGVPGELCIGGESLSRGYLNRPELTAEKFPPAGGPSLITPLSSPIYRTGDLARWLPDGNIEFLGRTDYQVKIRGNRVELGEIESRLLNHSEIKEAVVAAHVEGNGDKYLCAYFVSQKKLAASLLREYLSGRLTDYMIPAYFVQLEKLPLTPNGKLDRKALPLPKVEAGQEYEAPRDHVEEKLVSLWAEVLGIEMDVVGINDSFFDLGGHSLRATILIAKIHKEFDVNISLAEIFKTPVIKKIASLIKMVGPEENREIDSTLKIEEITI